MGELMRDTVSGDELNGTEGVTLPEKAIVHREKRVGLSKTRS